MWGGASTGGAIAGGASVGGARKWAAAIVGDAPGLGAGLERGAGLKPAAAPYASPEGAGLQLRRGLEPWKRTPGRDSVRGGAKGLGAPSTLRGCEQGFRLQEAP